MSTFKIRSGHCAGEYDAVFLSTDLEPDDAVALKVLAPRLVGVPLLVVVGEGNTSGKTAMMCDLLRQYGIDEQATVLQGRCSDSSYPDAALHSYQPTESSARGRATIAEAGGDDEVAAAVQGFLLKYNAPFALLLKPPHELRTVSTDALSRAVAAAYGSFNFVVLRALMRKESPNLTEDEAFGRQEALLKAPAHCPRRRRVPPPPGSARH